MFYWLENRKSENLKLIGLKIFVTDFVNLRIWEIVMDVCLQMKEGKSFMGIMIWVTCKHKLSSSLIQGYLVGSLYDYT